MCWVLVEFEVTDLVNRGILHDPDVYPEPMLFKPERYFNTEGKLDYSAIDPARFSFGYGRRSVEFPIPMIIRPNV